MYHGEICNCTLNPECRVNISAAALTSHSRHAIIDIRASDSNELMKALSIVKKLAEPVGREEAFQG